MKCSLTGVLCSAILGSSIFAGTLGGSIATAQDVKIGILLGYTGPIESLTPDMAAAAELAIDEVNKSGAFMNGRNVDAVRGDSTCVDASAAAAAATHLIASVGVKAIMGADCSGVTMAVLKNVALANGVVMISPSATSPALSTVADNGLFFRTAPSDARQGEIIAEVLKDKKIKSIAISYTNNDYGKGLADSIQSYFEKQGGTVTISVSHEDGKADYSAEIGALASAGGDMLVVVGYVDQGGKGIIQASLDSGAFDSFFLPDGMIGDSLPTAIGPDINGSIGTLPGTNSDGVMTFKALAEKEGFNKDGPFTAESYDATALILLAMQAANSTESSVFKSKIMSVANAPGTKIYPGELGKALKIISDGGDIDYVGASAVELIGEGESAGSYKEVEIKNGKFETIRVR